MRRAASCLALAAVGYFSIRSGAAKQVIRGGPWRREGRPVHAIAVIRSGIIAFIRRRAGPQVVFVAVILSICAALVRSKACAIRGDATIRFTATGSPSIRCREDFAGIITAASLVGRSSWAKEVGHCREPTTDNPLASRRARVRFHCLALAVAEDIGAAGCRACALTAGREKGCLEPIALAVAAIRIVRVLARAIGCRPAFSSAIALRRARERPRAVVHATIAG